MNVSPRMKPVLTAAAAVSLLAPAPASAAGFDTEHLFGFMIGSDIGSVGEREFQTQTTGRLGRAAGRYRFGEQEFELEWVPMRDIRFELGNTISAHQIGGVPGFADSRGFAWQGASIDVRYRLQDRDTAPFGMTLAIDGDLQRLDESSGRRTPSFGAGLTLALDREIIPGFMIAALNVVYRPEWTQDPDTRRVERETEVGASGAVMMRIGPRLLLGAEARYLRRYEGAGFEALAGQALFVGPTAYVQLTDRTRLTAGWSAQIWGRATRSAPLDLINFERHQLRVIYGISF